MKNLLSVAALCSIVATSVSAQDIKCASREALNAIVAGDAQKQEALNAYRLEANEHVAAYEKQVANAAQKTTATVTVPVVFHFVLTAAQQTEIKNIDGMQRRITSQLSVLNADFNSRNSDTSNIPAAFKSLKGNAEINFAIARIDPNGKSTKGFELKTTTQTVFSVGAGNEKHVLKGGLDAWAPDKYLNVWIVNLTDGVLGYAISAGNAAAIGQPEEGGVVIDYAAFGRRSVEDTYFIGSIDRGRTAVHEVGHYFDLDHIWGELDDCTDDDNVTDTPPQDKANSGCPSGILVNCNNTTGGEMYMNYMDYVNDACMQLFTKGQVSRMKAQWAQGGVSNTLVNNPALTQWPTAVSDIDIANELSVYPNPAGSVFSVNFVQPTSALKYIDIISLTGQSVKHVSVDKQNSTYTIDASGLAKGVYILRCNFEEGIVSRKIVLQ